MGNKTIYVKDESLWERARKIAGDAGLSGFIAEALKAYVKQKENEVALQAGEMTKVELPVGGFYEDEPDEPYRIAFIGRLLYDTDVEADPRCRVFETQGKQLLLYKNLEGPRQKAGAMHEIFRTYDDLAKSADAQSNFGLFDGPSDHDAIREIASKLGKDPVVWIR